MSPEHSLEAHAYTYDTACLAHIQHPCFSSPVSSIQVGSWPFIKVSSIHTSRVCLPPASYILAGSTIYKINTSDASHSLRHDRRCLSHMAWPSHMATGRRRVFLRRHIWSLLVQCLDSWHGQVWSACRGYGSEIYYMRDRARRCYECRIELYCLEHRPSSATV
jgi:hypothetical protein